ncbi:MAG: exo-alpha-sialidase [Planctomycetota bacterium]|nr:MAG: exo-alpha-sialidase [Planctomycetota bacterium]
MLLAPLALTLASAGAVAAEPRLEKTELYTAGEEGYASYRIPALAVTAKGTLLALCEARKSGRGDWGPIDIMLRRSTDGGRTWSSRQKVAEVDTEHRKNPVALKQNLTDPSAVTQNNPLIIPDRDGSAHLLFCHEYMRCFYRRSDDDGQTFSEPVEITDAFEPFREHYDWKVLATGPGHGVQLRSGRLVVPVWLSRGTGGHAHRPSAISTIYSDDHGETWKCGDIIAGENDPLVNPSESVAVELADGSVMLNIRSESSPNLRAVAISPDGATNWTRPRFDQELPEPVCMASMCRFSLADEEGGKNRLLFSNPHNLKRADGKEEPGKNRDRRNLTVKLSYDEGETWPVAKALEPGRSAYSDLAVGPDGTIYCVYERSRKVGGRHVSCLAVARFNLAWLTDGEDSLGEE